MVRLLGRCLPIICMPRKKRQSFPICEKQATGAKHQEEINKLFVRRVESIRVTHQGAIVKRLPLHTINERRLQLKKTKSKSTRQKGEKLLKPDDTEFDCETHISDRESKQKNRIKSKKKPSATKEKPTETKPPSNVRAPLEKLFTKTKKTKVPSPVPEPVVINDIPEKDHDDTSSISSSSSSSSMSSDWSTTTYPDSQSSEKSNDIIQRRQSMPISSLATQLNHESKHRSCVESFYLGREHVRSSLSPTTETKTSLSKIKEDLSKSKTSQQIKRNDIKPTGKSKQVLQNVRKMIKDQNVQEQHFNVSRHKESIRL